jgi:small-conductance mechanosensitive channel
VDDGKQSWTDFLEIQEDLPMQIREAITSNGARIAYPVRTVHQKNERTPEDPLAATPPGGIGKYGFLT